MDDNPFKLPQRPWERERQSAPDPPGPLAVLPVEGPADPVAEEDSSLVRSLVAKGHTRGRAMQAEAAAKGNMIHALRWLTSNPAPTPPTSVRPAQVRHQERKSSGISWFPDFH